MALPRAVLLKPSPPTLPYFDAFINSNTKLPAVDRYAEMLTVQMNSAPLGGYKVWSSPVCDPTRAQ